MDDEEFLNLLVKKIGGNSNTNTGYHLLPDDYSRLLACFLPRKPSSTRGKAHVALAAICDRQRRSNSTNSLEDDDSSTRGIIHLFSSAMQTRLNEVEELPLIEALSFLIALFTIDWRAGSSIFTRDGFQDTMMDGLDLFPTSVELPKAIASLLSSACGHKICLASLSPRCISWLETTYQHGKDDRLQATLSVALLKLSQGSEVAANTVGGDGSGSLPVKTRQTDYLQTFIDIITRSGTSIQDAADAIEGLAYLSTKPAFKELIIKNKNLLQKLISFHKDLRSKAALDEPLGTAPFGLAALIANLSSYRPRLTEEQLQIERLRQMAQSGASKDGKGRFKDTSEDVLDDDEHVRLRANQLVEAGAVTLLVALSKSTDGAATKMMIGKAFLGLVEEKGNRGKVLQAGGAKTLMSLIRSSQQKPDEKSFNPLAKGNMEYADTVSVQALAKLSITSSPLQVFGPDVNLTIEAIKPFACLLLHQSSTLLQRFESLMALTNISSVGPDLADRVAQTEGVLGKVETLLLEDNVLVRRAATELLCNLVSGSESVFNQFSGDDGPSGTTKSGQTKSRIHILVALTDVDDEPTRLAASGALAVLTGSPTACSSMVSLQIESHRALPILKQLIDPGDNDDGKANPNQGLMHRGIVCIRNILVNTTDATTMKVLLKEVMECGLLESLTNIVKSAEQGEIPEIVLRPVAESLQCIMKERNT